VPLNFMPSLPSLPPGSPRAQSRAQAQAQGLRLSPWEGEGEERSARGGQGVCVWLLAGLMCFVTYFASQVTLEGNQQPRILWYTCGLSRSPRGRAVGARFVTGSEMMAPSSHKL